MVGQNGNGIVRETEDGGSLAAHPILDLAKLDLATLERRIEEIDVMRRKMRHLFELRAMIEDIRRWKRGS